MPQLQVNRINGVLRIVKHIIPWCVKAKIIKLWAAYQCRDAAVRRGHQGLTVLQNDKRPIFSAAAHAQRAADYLHSLQPAQQSEPIEERAAA